MMRLRRGAPTDGERGSSAVELVIVVPVLLIVLGAIALGGRMAVANMAVGSAAAEAARAASLARNVTDARAGATAAAESTLRNQHLKCVPRDVSVDTSEFSRPVGQAAEVRATVRCDVNLAGLALPGIPTHKNITETAASPLDTYRER